jgi:sodium/potassium-transporting ATPase subunit alpha
MAMDPSDETTKMGPRIRYADEEAVDADRFTALRLQRTDTQGSGMSIRSVNSMRRRGSVDPATALPITYRTV